jgi:hypothetical protein
MYLWILDRLLLNYRTLKPTTLMKNVRSSFQFPPVSLSTKPHSITSQKAVIFIFIWFSYILCDYALILFTHPLPAALLACQRSHFVQYARAHSISQERVANDLHVSMEWYKHHLANKGKNYLFSAFWDRNSLFFYSMLLSSRWDMTVWMELQ